MNDKDQLLQEERLTDWLHVHYKLSLRRIEPWGRAWKIFTDQGEYCLKEVSEKGKQQWDFVADVSHHLNQQREPGLFLAEPVLTQSKKRTFAGIRCRYVLIPWVDGKHATLSSSADWANWSGKIAQFHQATNDFSLHRMESWHDRWNQHLYHLEIGHIAAKWTAIPTVSDRKILQSVSYVKGIIHNLLEYDRNMEGEAVRQETAKFSKVCHMRIHRQHLIQAKDRRSYLIDPREMAIDIRTTDLARWIIYAYRKTKTPEVISTILRGYQSKAEQPLLKDEYALIYGHLLFPEKYCRLLEQIYIQQSVPISETGEAIHRASEREKQKIPLLKQYTEIVKRDYGVRIPHIEWIHH